VVATAGIYNVAAFVVFGRTNSVYRLNQSSGRNEAQRTSFQIQIVAQTAIGESFTMNYETIADDSDELQGYNVPSVARVMDGYLASGGVPTFRYVSGRFVASNVSATFDKNGTIFGTISTNNSLLPLAQDPTLSIMGNRSHKQSFPASKGLSISTLPGTMDGWSMQPWDGEAFIYDETVLCGLFVGQNTKTEVFTITWYSAIEIATPTVSLGGYVMQQPWGDFSLALEMLRAYNLVTENPEHLSVAASFMQWARATFVATGSLAVDSVRQALGFAMQYGKGVIRRELADPENYRSMARRAASIGAKAALMLI
jgi:hypothetical protein